MQIVLFFQTIFIIKIAKITILYLLKQWIRQTTILYQIRQHMINSNVHFIKTTSRITFILTKIHKCIKFVQNVNLKIIFLIEKFSQFLRFLNQVMMKLLSFQLSLSSEMNKLFWIWKTSKASQMIYSKMKNQSLFLSQKV